MPTTPRPHGLIVAMALFAVRPAPAQSRAPLHVADNGVVVMEVESHPPSGGWVRQTRLDGYTGEACYRWAGAGRTHSRPLTYRIVIFDPGVYRLCVRNDHDHADRTRTTGCDTRMDGGSRRKLFSSPLGQWTWQSRHEVGPNNSPNAAYALSVGEHTLEIAGRRANFRIDRIVLFDANSGIQPSVGLAPTRRMPARPALDGIRNADVMWRAGRLGSLLTAVRRIAADPNPPARRQAIEAADRLTAYADRQLERAEALKIRDPVCALLLMDLLVARYRGSDVGATIAARAAEWRREPHVRNALRAHAMVTKLQRLAGAFRGEGTVDDPRFAQRHRSALRQILQGYRIIRSRYSDTPAHGQARDLAAEFGLPVE